jgi:lysophospholipase L1-like esterase
MKRAFVLRPHSTRFHRIYKAFLFLSLCLAAYVVFTVARSWLLLSKGKEIAAQSANFSRTYFVGNATQLSLTYLVIGDSTAAGWGAGDLTSTFPYRVAQDIAARGYYVRVVNKAVGGARLQDVLQNQLTSLEELRPQLITVSIGANDATHFTSPNEYSNQVRTLLQALRDSGVEQILVANTPDMYQAPALTWPLAWAVNNRARQQNQILERATQGSTLRIVDLYTQGKLVYARNKSLYAADLFHPSAQGYGIWAKLFTKQLQR